ncbi:MAG TPA: hypothetical protein VFT72_03260 [Opitutaceae bacterium]|nr:hypothetical protein [Opitutaceae bacterium]
MNKISLKTHPIVVVGGIVAILASSAGFWRSLSRDEFQSLVASKQNEATRLTDNIRYGQKLDAQYTQLLELNKELSLRLTAPDDLASNQQYFYKIAAATGAKISDLRQVALPKKKKNAAPTLFAPVPYLITVNGTFTQVLSFLRNVEAGTRLGRITAGNLSTPTAKDGVPTELTMSITAEFVGAL